MEFKITIKIDNKIISLFKSLLSKKWVLIAIFISFASLVYAGVLTYNTGEPLSGITDLVEFTDGQVISASEVNNNFQALAYESNRQNSYLVPTGAIIMWSGSINNIPAGWQLCDGSNGSPDLTDRFILSVAGSAENPGATGGNANHQYRLVANNLPGHNHSVSLTSGSENAPDYVVSRSGATPYGCGGSCSLTHLMSLRSNNPHTHSVSGNTGNNSTSNTAFDIRPKYYKLAFIIKL